MSKQENIALSEQAPLNPDAAAGETTEGAAEGAAAPAKKNWWWTRKAKPAAAATEGAPESNNDNNKDVEGGTQAPPACKKVWWWQRKPCAQNAQEGNAPCGMTYGVNLVQRDDHQLQHGIDLGVEDIYGEPDSVHSIDAIWKANYAVFRTVRCFCYKLFSLIIAIPLAIVFGILFALVSALSVFLCIPLGKLLSIPAGWLWSVWSVIVSSVFNPIFSSIGQIFGNVKVSRYGINSDPTAVITA